MSGTPPVPHAQARAAHPANAGGAALQAVTIKSFAISKCATTEQRRAERKRDPSASHQEEFGERFPFSALLGSSAGMLRASKSNNCFFL